MFAIGFYRFLGVIEQRLTGTVAFILIGCSVFLATFLRVNILNYYFRKVVNNVHLDLITRKSIAVFG